MACYHPIKAYQPTAGAKLILLPDDKKEHHNNHHIANIAIPCGICIGCRSQHAAQWGDRCEHEATLYENNIFITLTFDDEHLPQDNYLDTQTLQKWIKRLRKDVHTHPDRYTSNPRSNIRYFASGEYGEQNARPHYHAIIFNLDLPDRYKVGGTENKRLLYASETLAKTWPDGAARFGQATGAAANYIAQYNLKKQGQGNHDIDGVYRPKPFLLMSRKPAIGTKWLEQYRNDLRKGYLTKDGKIKGIPRAYLKRLKAIDPQLYEQIQHTRHTTREPTDNDTPQRRKDAEIIHTQLKQLTENRTL